MKFKHFISLIALALVANTSYAVVNVMEDDGKTIVDGNTAYSAIGNVAVDAKKNLREATEINSEMVIVYTNQGMLDRAKTKLIKAQELNRNNKFNLAIVDYASGYYYQAIGANSIAEKSYKKALENHKDNYEAINFYAQFLCIAKKDYTQAQALFDKSLFISTNDDMAQTLYMYSECMYREGKLKDAVSMMEKSTKFGSDYMVAKLRLAEMLYDDKQYAKSYKTIYAMKDDSNFFNNKRVLELRLKLAQLMKNKNEAAIVKLILSSKNYNDDDSIEEFYIPDSADLND